MGALMSREQLSKPAPFKVGQRLQYKLTGVEITFFRNDRDESDGVVVLKAGVEGVITEIHNGYNGHWHDFDEGDGLEWVNPQHGWNTVSIDGYAARAVDINSMQEWEVLS